MLRISKVILLAAVVLLAACKKGEPVNEFYFASFTAELLALPGTTTVDIYVGDKIIDSLTAGTTKGVISPMMLAANQPSTISFKKAGTDILLLDTVLTAAPGDRVPLKLAYSAELGIQSFITGSAENIPADSGVFFLFNQLPVELQADDVYVDALLFRFNGAEYEDTGVSWDNLEKNKLHPEQKTIAVTENEVPIQYIIRLKNRATGEYLGDALALTDISTTFLPGQRQIVSVKGRQTRGKWRFYSEAAAY